MNGDCDTQTRCHQGIEKEPHRVLDAVAVEDAHRGGSDSAPMNFSYPRCTEINAVRAAKSKASNSIKSNHAGWDDRFLSKLVT